MVENSVGPNYGLTQKFSKIISTKDRKLLQMLGKDKTGQKRSKTFRLWKIEYFAKYWNVYQIPKPMLVKYGNFYQSYNVSEIWKILPKFWSKIDNSAKIQISS